MTLHMCLRMCCMIRSSPGGGGRLGGEQGIGIAAAVKLVNKMLVKLSKMLVKLRQMLVKASYWQ